MANETRTPPSHVAQLTANDFQDPGTTAERINFLLAELQERIDNLEGRNGALPRVGNTLVTPLYNDYTVSGFAAGRSAAAPTLTAFRGNIDLYAFTGVTTTQELMFAIHILHDLKAGTDLTFHVHWSHIIAAPTGSVKWNVEFTSARGYNLDAYHAPISLSTVQAAGAQYSHHISNDDNMKISSRLTVQPDSIVLGRIYRDPTDSEDTFANDAYLINMDLHYQMGQIGTTERNRSWASAGFPTGVT